jgi:hypothetical protein
MRPNKFPKTIKILGFLILHSAMTTLTQGQPSHVLLHLERGSITYKLHGQWRLLSTSLLLDDTCWIQVMDANGSYRLVKDKLCSFVSGKCIRQIKANIFDICDSSAGGIIKVLQGIYENLQMEQPKKVPAKWVANNGLFFPAAGECLMSPDSIKLKYIALDLGFRNPKMKTYDLRDDILSTLFGQTDSATWNTTLAYGTKAVLRKDQNSDNVFDVVFYRKNKATVTQYFSIANGEMIESLSRDFDLLASCKAKLDGSDYELYKAILYTNYGMYSEAGDTYTKALAKYPNAQLLEHSWSNFVNQIAAKNRQVQISAGVTR